MRRHTRSYEEFIEKLAQFAEGMLLRTPPNVAKTGWSDLASSGQARAGIDAACRTTSASATRRIFTQSVAEFLEPWFESEELKVTLATDGVIGTNGGPRSPGTAYVLLHHVMGKRGWTSRPVGICARRHGRDFEAIAGAARAAGAEIRTDARGERRC